MFPLAYGLHIAEEYGFHFPAYVANLSGRHISNPQFLVINAVFWLLMVATVVLVLARPSQAWLVVTLAAVLGINAALHIVGSVVTVHLFTGHRHGRVPLCSSRRLRASANPSARQPWPCGASRSSRRGHSRGRHAPGGQSIAHPVAVSGLTPRCSGLAPLAAELDIVRRHHNRPLRHAIDRTFGKQTAMPFQQT